MSIYIYTGSKGHGSFSSQKTTINTTINMGRLCRRNFTEFWFGTDIRWLRSFGPVRNSGSMQNFTPVRNFNYMNEILIRSYFGFGMEFSFGTKLELGAELKFSRKFLVGAEILSSVWNAHSVRKFLLP